MSQPPPPKGPEIGGDTVELGREVVKEVRRSGPPRPSPRARAARGSSGSVPAIQLAAPSDGSRLSSSDESSHAESAQPEGSHSESGEGGVNGTGDGDRSLADPPETKEAARESDDHRSRPEPEPEAMEPIAAMPIISLGERARETLDSVEVAASGLHRTSVPPPPVESISSEQATRDSSLSDPLLDGWTSPLPPIRPPADSLVQAIPEERVEEEAPLEADSMLDIEIEHHDEAVSADESNETNATATAAEAASPDNDVAQVRPAPSALRAFAEAQPPAELTAQDIASEPDDAVPPGSFPPPKAARDARRKSDVAPKRVAPEPAKVPLVEPESAPEPTPPPAVDTRVLAERGDISPKAAAAVLLRPPSESEPDLVAAKTPSDRTSEIPPEVDPEDMEIHEVKAPVVTSGKTQALPSAVPPPAPQPPAGQPARPIPLPNRASSPDLSGAVQQASADPSFKRARYWWDELFGDDFLRTMDRLTERQVKTETNFIEESLAVQKGGIILDLACGTGKHAVEMASRGYNVVGYDLSVAMLARAADEAHERSQKLNFLQGDMRDMGFEEMFDGVYCWSTSFGYFDDEKNQLVASRIHRSLRKGGMLLLDLANRDFVTQRQPSLVWFEGEGCVCMDEMRVDFITSRLKVKRMVMLEDGRTREMDYSIRLYTLHELGRMLHDVGFKVTEVSGHPATPGVFMGADSPRLIVLAEKA